MIELSALVRDLRAELTEAIVSAQDERLHFGLGTIELEITVAVSSEGSSGGKARFWVLELGADGKDSSASTHRIKLTLEPRLDGRATYISGAAEDGED